MESRTRVIFCACWTSFCLDGSRSLYSGVVWTLFDCIYVFNFQHLYIYFWVQQIILCLNQMRCRQKALVSGTYEFTKHSLFCPTGFRPCIPLYIFSSIGFFNWKPSDALPSVRNLRFYKRNKLIHYKQSRTISFKEAGKWCHLSPSMSLFTL